MNKAPVELDSKRLWISDISCVGACRRELLALASDLGFNETDQGRIGLVISEAANNLVLHARGGEVSFRPLLQDGRPGIEILTLDNGPGMADTEACMTDGYSTSGTSGIGLGTIRRAADDFDIYSNQTHGTALLARVWSQRQGPAPRFPFNWTSLSRPMPEETACGDAAHVELSMDRGHFMMADGLGHGPEAAAAARLAVEVFTACAFHPPTYILERMHEALKHSRGAVIAVATVDPDQSEVVYASVGNIAAYVSTDGNLVGLNAQSGIVGSVLPRLREQRHPWTASSTLLMHSDGLKSLSRADDLPDFRRHDLALIAAHFLHRCRRSNPDDAAVLLARQC